GLLRSAQQSDYATQASLEAAAAPGILARSGVPARAASTVFFGGGTPTLLPADDLARMLGAIDDAFGIEPHAEITTEANPDSVD
ncbi:hypothetical protein ACC691_40270, partial [Rhizobium johnstonii]